MWANHTEIPLPTRSPPPPPPPPSGLQGFKDTEWLPMMVRQRVVPIGRTGNERWPSTTFLRIKDNVIEGAAPADAGNYCSFYK